MNSKNNSPDFRDRRVHPRFNVNGRIPGSFVVKDQSDTVFMCIDISKFGLGIILDKQVDRGEEIVWNYDESEQIILKVMWVAPTEEAGLNMYHCGLYQTTEAIDLTTIVEDLLDDLSLEGE